LKVALYSRVSTIDQHPENHMVALRQYAKSMNYDVYSEYEDKTSGAKASRPALDLLMQDARKKSFDKVVVWSVDRLGRNVLHMLQTVEEWKHLGISFSVTTLGIDTSTPVGSFVLGLLSQVAALEREFNRQRTSLAYQRAKKEKRHWGRPAGSKDKKRRRKSGYINRWIKEQEKTKADNK
jgi:DNA invertase Pin-like site-specific DNA recombinase